MSPLTLVGILVTLTPSLADVSHVLDGSAHPPDPNAINPHAVNRLTDQFWWMDSDSPLKAAYDYYKKCSTKGNCVNPENVNAPPQPFLPSQTPESQHTVNINVKKNPFFNGDFDPSKGTAKVNEGGAQIDISKNPFLSGSVVSSGEGKTVTKSQGGFLGVQPAQPFGKKPGFATTHPLEQKRKPGFATTHPLEQKKKPSEGGVVECKGAGFACVEKELCVNGVVNKNGEGVLQTRTDVHYCKQDKEVCCQLNNLNEITAGKSSVPGSTIKFAGGAGFSPGLIYVQPLNVQPDIVFAGEHGHHSSSSTSKSIRDTSQGPNSVFSSTVDYSDTKFDSDVRFASTFQGPAYLPPVAPTSPKPAPKPFETQQPSINQQFVPRPSTPAPYIPPSPTIPTTTYRPAPSPAYSPTPAPTYRPSPTPAPYRPTPSSTYRPAPSPAYSPTPAPTYRPPSTTYRPAPSTSREYLPPRPSTPRPSSTVTQYVPPYQPSVTPQRPYQPSVTPQRPYQPSVTPQQPYQPSVTPQRPYQPSVTPQKPYQPSVTPQQPYQPSVTPQRPYQPSVTPQRPYQPPQTSPRPYQPPQTTPRPYQPPQQPYQPSTSRPTTSREYLPPQPSSPRPNPFIPQETTPRPYQPQPSIPQPRPTSPPYRPPSPQPQPRPTSPPYRPPSPQPQPRPTSPPYRPPSPTPPPYRPSPTSPPYQPSPTQPPFRPQPSITPGYQYPTPSPSFPPSPSKPSPPPFRPTPSVPQFPPSRPTSLRPYQPPQPTSAPNPAGGYEYPKPSPTFGYPTTPRPGSSSNVNNQYIPPPKKPSEGDQNSEAANIDGTIVRPTTPRTQFQGELNTAPPPGCAAALKCVQEIYCTAEGVISPVPVVLTKEQELSRVPTTVCQDTESGIIGKCCRDPNYKDPWPSANLVDGVDDGQYKEDDSIGQYQPDLQRPVRSQKGGPRQEASNTNTAVQQAPQPTCGERHQNTSPPGPGPLDVNFAEIPWQAMVLRDSNRSLLCGGVIVKPNAVLTAAHCVEGLETSDILIKGGEWKLGIDEEPLPFQIVKVSVVVRHPQYQTGSFVNDLALLVLEEKLRPSKNIGTLCLPPPNQIPTENCIATGWGKRILQLHAKGAIMHSINVNVMDNQQCQETLRSKFQHAESNYSPNTLCGYSDIDQCKVDYGSALACYSNGHYTLSGVYSWDTGCKQKGQIGGYVAPDVDWIETTLAKPIRELKKLES